MFADVIACLFYIAQQLMISLVKVFDLSQYEHCCSMHLEVRFCLHILLVSLHS